VSRFWHWHPGALRHRWRHPLPLYCAAYRYRPFPPCPTPFPALPVGACSRLPALPLCLSIRCYGPVGPDCFGWFECWLGGVRRHALACTAVLLLFRKRCCVRDARSSLIARLSCPCDPGSRLHVGGGDGYGLGCGGRGGLCFASRRGSASASLALDILGLRRVVLDPICNGFFGIYTLLGMAPSE
jgi:hypothetical protein